MPFNDEEAQTCLSMFNGHPITGLFVQKLSHGGAPLDYIRFRFVLGPTFFMNSRPVHFVWDGVHDLIYGLCSPPLHPYLGVPVNQVKLFETK